MANWTAILTKADKDASGKNSNLVLSVEFANSETGETQTRVFPTSKIDKTDLKAWAASVIQTLNDRDETLLVAKKEIADRTVLATG